MEPVELILGTGRCVYTGAGRDGTRGTHHGCSPAMLTTEQAFERVDAGPTPMIVWCRSVVTGNVKQAPCASRGRHRELDDYIITGRARAPRLGYACFT